MKFFVYGTLKPGFGNYRIVGDLVTDATEDAVTGFTLHDLGAFPGAIPSPEGRVTGFVLTVGEDDAEEATFRLDRLEGAPHFYRRELVTTEGGNEAWFYVFNRPIYTDRQPHIGDTWPAATSDPEAPDEWPEEDFAADCDECYYGDCKEDH